MLRTPPVSLSDRSIQKHLSLCELVLLSSARELFCFCVCRGLVMLAGRCLGLSPGALVSAAAAFAVRGTSGAVEANLTESRRDVMLPGSPGNIPVMTGSELPYFCPNRSSGADAFSARSLCSAEHSSLFACVSRRFKVQVWEGALTPQLYAVCGVQ